MKKRTYFFIFILLALFVTGCSSNSIKSPTGDAITVTTFKPPDCGCCSGWISYANGKGMDVTTIMENDMDSLKDKYNIPQNMRSCHTSIMEGYFVEGHMPMEAINKLLTEKPDIDGIALPGMPPGSAGMPGQKQGQWTIYSIKDGQVKEFMRI